MIFVVGMLTIVLRTPPPRAVLRDERGADDIVV
jgi:hypothetical protein